MYRRGGGGKGGLRGLGGVWIPPSISCRGQSLPHYFRQCGHVQ